MRSIDLNDSTNLEMYHDGTVIVTDAIPDVPKGVYVDFSTEWGTGAYHMGEGGIVAYLDFQEGD
jgi:hypothetical protein